MPRIQRENNNGQESYPTTEPQRSGRELSEDLDTEEQYAPSESDLAAIGLSPRENLTTCGICQQEMEREEFRKHVTTKHKSTVNGTPKGLYGCWSGQEFWLPLKFANGPCKWVCTVCGSAKYYFGEGITHGGPTTRLVDRRYGLTYCEGARYPAHKRAFGKIEGAAGPVVFMHEGAPNPEQPKQDDPNLKEMIEAYEKSLPRKADAKPSSKRNKPNPRRLRASG